MITSWNRLGMGIAAGVLALGGASAANATTQIVPINTFTSMNDAYFVLTNGTGPGDPFITAQFGSGTIAAGSSFDYTFAFRLTQDGLGSGDLSASWASSALSLDITHVIINGVDYIADAAANSSGFALHVADISIVNYANFVNPNDSLLEGWNTIEIIGSSTGTRPNGFNGNVTFTAVAAPVPEPAAWALMLGGFGLVGLAMRQRRRNVSFV